MVYLKVSMNFFFIPSTSKKVLHAQLIASNIYYLSMVCNYIGFFFFFLIDYRGRSFPLLIQKEEELNDSINEKGVDSSTIDPN